MILYFYCLNFVTSQKNKEKLINVIKSLESVRNKGSGQKLSKIADYKQLTVAEFNPRHGHALARHSPGG